ncbi:MAG: DUF3592 domain-containing protein, partial [Clostridia bacterium]|nr:DUF3592 domain-containing protein [Clostridia bacterium]
MDVKDIGIKKNRVLISFLLILVALAFVITFIFMWWEYASQDRYRYLRENAIEVETTIVSYGYDYSSSDKNTRNWVTIYEYNSEWGTVYKGRVAVHPDESAAKAEVGEKIKIYIDPNSDWSSDVFPVVNYERALRNAIIWCFPVPIVLYLLIYRCIYRNVLNKKIKKKVYGSTYNNDRIIHTPLPNTVTQGEVTKVAKWIVCYVKVKYQDENGEMREKWARSWFTHKETKFLQQKKIINIVPYKNTYGIL